MDDAEWERLLQQMYESVLNQRRAEELILMVAEWFAGHWRDDDNPKEEYRSAREGKR